MAERRGEGTGSGGSRVRGGAGGGADTVGGGRMGARTGG
jgi:hypothetical protein